MYISVILILAIQFYLHICAANELTIGSYNRIASDRFNPIIENTICDKFFLFFQMMPIYIFVSIK